MAFNNTVCTFEPCDVATTSFYAYRPSLGQNAALLAIFGVSFVGFVAEGLWFRTWGFLIAMGLGTLTEILGYVGRVMSWNNPWDMNAFLIQICCLNIAVAFICAGIYLTLSRIVITFGPHLSYLKPNSYQYIFCTCDFVSLVLQAAGGGLASIAAQNGESTKTGDNFFIAGIASQIFSLVVFMILSLIFAIRVWQNRDQLDDDLVKQRVRKSMKFRLFIAALALATVLILIRNIYRIIELAQDWNGYLISVQRYFFILEGLCVAVACLLLNIFHPGLCFGDGYGRSSTIARYGGNNVEKSKNFQLCKKKDECAVEDSASV